MIFRLPCLVALAALASACAVAPPVPPPPPVAQYVVPPETQYVSELFGYSQAVRVGPWVTVSAVPGFDIQKRGFPEAYEDQVRAAFDNLRLVLAAAGVRLEEVVEITTYQLDMAQFNATVDGRNEAFGLHKPTWTAVGVASLPLPSMQFQVGARAWSPGGVVAPAADAGGESPAAPAQAAPAAVPAAEPKPEKKKDNAPPRFMNRPGY